MTSWWTVALAEGKLCDDDIAFAHTTLCLFDDALSASLVEELLRDVGRDWVVPHGRVAGKWPKRLAKLLRCRGYPITLKRKQLIARLGAALGPRTRGQRTYHGRIVQGFPEPGAYNDENSCFRLGHKCDSATPHLDRCDRVSTLQLVNGAGKGIGRCIIIRDKDHDDVWYVTNAYGVLSVVCARILAHVLDMQYSRLGVSLVNEGTTQGWLWLNEDAYVLYPLGREYPTTTDLRILEVHWCCACDAAGRACTCHCRCDAERCPDAWRCRRATPNAYSISRGAALALAGIERPPASPCTCSMCTECGGPMCGHVRCEHCHEFVCVWCGWCSQLPDARCTCPPRLSEKQRAAGLGDLAQAEAEE